jgi:hypothetical protein
VTGPQFIIWRKSTRSGGGSNCVEVAVAGGGKAVGVRDSKNRDGGILVFSPAEWTAFIGSARAGELT